MVYQIHNGSRSIATRTIRAAGPSHKGLKQYSPVGQQRLIRGRPVTITDDQLLDHLQKLREMAKAGLIYLTTTDGRPFNLDTMTEGDAKPPPKLPDPPLDNAANDPNEGLGIDMSRFAGEKPPPVDFEMPVDPPAAAMDNPLAGLEEPVVEETAETPQPVTVPSKFDKKGGRR